MPRCSFNARDFAVFLDYVKVTNKCEKRMEYTKNIHLCACVQVKTTFT